MVNTQALEPYRRNKEWKRVFQNLNKTYLSPKVKAYMEDVVLKKFDHIIIVTSSPGKYAKAILEKHEFLLGINVIAYHDTKLHKPNPEPYLKALFPLNGNFDEVYIYGDNEKDFIAAENLEKIIQKKVFKVGCSWYVKCNYRFLDRHLTF